MTWKNKSHSSDRTLCTSLITKNQELCWRTSKHFHAKYGEIQSLQLYSFCISHSSVLATATDGSQWEPLLWREKTVVGYQKLEKFRPDFSYIWNRSLTSWQHLTLTFLYEKHLYTMMNVLHIVWRRVQKESGEGNLDTGREEIRWSTGAWKKLAVEASVGSEVWRRLRIKEKVEAWNKDVE